MNFDEAYQLVTENPDLNKYLLGLSGAAKAEILRQASVLHGQGIIVRPTINEYIYFALANQLSSPNTVRE